MTTRIAGILNVTPDSFSDGGEYFAPEMAVEQARRMLADGADIIDIGAESTRPGASSLTHDEEWERLQPVLEALCGENIKISIDTRHPQTAEKSLKYGIEWINDVSGFDNPAMVEVAKNCDAKLVIMHNLGIPADPKNIIDDKLDVIDEVYHWAEDRIKSLSEQGISNNRIIFDPGIGFGKDAEQSLNLLKNISHFKKLGVEIMVGHSRKSFLTGFTDKPAAGRDFETAIISAYLAQQKVDFLRVHNVEKNLQAVKIATALDSE